jgi:hypothetical protein
VSHAFRQRCSVPSANEHLVIASPYRPDLSLDDLPFVRLRVDDPHACARDEDVVDVSSTAGDQSIVERKHFIADFARNERSQPTFALAALPQDDSMSRAAISSATAAA